MLPRDMIFSVFLEIRGRIIRIGGWSIGVSGRAVLAFTLLLL